MTIYKPIKRRAIHGDQIVITGNESGHYFPVGATAKVTSLYSTGNPPHFTAKSLSDERDEFQILTNSDDYRVIQPLKEKKKKRRKKKNDDANK